MRSALIPCIVASLALGVAIAACATPFEGGDDTFHRGGARTAPPRTDASTNAGSSGGGTKTPRDGGGEPWSDGGENDAGVALPPTCDPSHGVGEIIDVPGLASASAVRAEARLSADELNVVFAQVRDPAAAQFVWDLYTASRPSTTEPFGTIQLVSTTQTAFSGSLSPDGLSLYFTPFNVDGANGLQVTTRAAGGAFAGAAIVAGSPPDSYAPFATSDGRLLFAAYSQNAPALIRAATLSGAGLSNLQTLLGVAGLDVDYPSLSSDATELFYTVFTEPDHRPAYRRATRLADESYAGAAALAGLDELNQEVTWVSADACRLYMTDWRGNLLRVGQRLP